MSSPPLRAKDLRGTWATLLLPIAADDAIDFARLAAEIDAICASGVDGVYSNGTAGELHNQTESEFDAIHRVLADRCHAARLPFQIGASHPSPLISLQRVRRTVELAPAAFQVILPDWVTVTDDEAIAFLTRMAEAAAGIPLVLYNPPHARRVLDPEQIGALARAVPALIGVKVAGGDERWYERMRTHMAGLSVFVPGHHLATGVSHGAHGSYSNVACLNPAAAVRWYRQMLADLPAALEVESRLRAFFDRHIVPLITEQRYSNPAVDKLLAAIGGWSDIGTRLRWPYRSIDPAEALRLRPLLYTNLPELAPHPSLELAGAGRASPAPA